MGKQLRLLVVLAEELGSIINTLMVSHRRPKNFFLAFMGTAHGIQTCIQENKHTYKIQINEISKHI